MVTLCFPWFYSIHLLTYRDKPGGGRGIAIYLFCILWQGERGEAGPPGRGERGEPGAPGPKVSYSCIWQ